jgi:hypothetical protein
VWVHGSKHFSSEAQRSDCETRSTQASSRWRPQRKWAYVFKLAGARGAAVRVERPMTCAYRCKWWGRVAKKADAFCLNHCRRSNEVTVIKAVMRQGRGACRREEIIEVVLSSRQLPCSVSTRAHLLHNASDLREISRLHIPSLVLHVSSEVEMIRLTSDCRHIDAGTNQETSDVINQASASTILPSVMVLSSCTSKRACFPVRVGSANPDLDPRS